VRSRGCMPKPKRPYPRSASGLESGNRRCTEWRSGMELHCAVAHQVAAVRRARAAAEDADARPPRTRRHQRPRRRPRRRLAPVGVGDERQRAPRRRPLPGPAPVGADAAPLEPRPRLLQPTGAGDVERRQVVQRRRRRRRPRRRGAVADGVRRQRRPPPPRLARDAVGDRGRRRQHVQQPRRVVGRAGVSASPRRVSSPPRRWRMPFARRRRRAPPTLSGLRATTEQSPSHSSGRQSALSSVAGG